MVFDNENTRNKKVELYMEDGTIVVGASRYDTETREAVVYVKKDGKYVVENGSVLKKSIKLPGSYIMVDGVRY